MLADWLTQVHQHDKGLQFAATAAANTIIATAAAVAIAAVWCQRRDGGEMLWCWHLPVAFEGIGWPVIIALLIRMMRWCLFCLSHVTSWHRCAMCRSVATSEHLCQVAAAAAAVAAAAHLPVNWSHSCSQLTWLALIFHLNALINLSLFYAYACDNWIIVLCKHQIITTIYIEPKLT